MSTARKILLAILLVSLTGTAFGAGTFASFSASTTNSGSTFASGTLILKDTIGATACFSSSTGSGNVTTNYNAGGGCAAGFNVVTAKPGDAASTVDIDLENAGNINAGSLKMYMEGASGTGCANGDSSGSYHGTGLLCSMLQVTVTELNPSNNAVIACRFPTPQTNSACTSIPTTVGTIPTLTDFSTSYFGTVSGQTGLDLGTSPYSGGTVLTSSNGQTRRFRVSLGFPSSADNTYQGRTATFALTFRIEQ